MRSSLLGLLFGIFVLVGCGGRLEDRLNCRQACDRYADCLDSDYDVGACIDRCTDRAEESEEYSRRVDVCESCLEDRSCSEATVACAVDCADVVP